MVLLRPELIVRFVQNAPKSTLALLVFCGILRLSQDSFGGRSYSLLTGSALVSFSTVRAEPVLFLGGGCYCFKTELSDPCRYPSRSMVT